jgi:hypothetical protein
MESLRELESLSVQDNQIECRRCGFQWAVSNEKRGRKDLLCVSCRMKPASMLQYGKLRCIPHKGALDGDLNPIDEFGVLVMAGVRVCGHRDCVNVAHVVAG